MSSGSKSMQAETSVIFSSLHKYKFSYLCASIESPQIHNSFLKADDFDLELFNALFQDYFFQIQGENYRLKFLSVQHNKELIWLRWYDS